MSSETSDQRPVRLSTMATRPSEPEHLPCPRCESTNTKFCYYNNYNLSQPRHFCKSCRRYWTRGGTLRNVPVGGGSRKSSASYSHKRPRTATTSMSPSATTASATTTTGSSSNSENIAHLEQLHANPLSPMVPQIVSGSVPMAGTLMGCEVNLNEAVPEASNFGSLLASHVGAGLLPYGGGFGLGLGSGLHGLGFGLGPLDWPMEPVGHQGNVNSNIGLGGGGAGAEDGGDGNGNSGSGSAGSSSGGCNTWQMGGGVDGGLGDGDCFGWPELAISMPGKGLK